MPRIASLFFIFSLVATVVPASAQDYRAGEITISAPWSRATVGTSRPAAAYFTLHNGGNVPNELLTASTPVAGRVELHETKMVNDVMQMMAVPALAVGAGQTVTLSPAGYHLMLMDLKAALPKDSTVPMTLVFKDAKGTESRLELKLPVAAAAAATHKH